MNLSMFTSPKRKTIMSTSIENAIAKVNTIHAKNVEKKSFIDGATKQQMFYTSIMVQTPSGPYRSDRLPNIKAGGVMITRLNGEIKGACIPITIERAGDLNDAYWRDFLIALHQRGGELLWENLSKVTTGELRELVDDPQRALKSVSALLRPRKNKETSEIMLDKPFTFYLKLNYFKDRATGKVNQTIIYGPDKQPIQWEDIEWTKDGDTISMTIQPSIYVGSLYCGTNKASWQVKANSIIVTSPITRKPRGASLTSDDEHFLEGLIESDPSLLEEIRKNREEFAALRSRARQIVEAPACAGPSGTTDPVSLSADGTSALHVDDEQGEDENQQPPIAPVRRGRLNLKGN